MSAASTGDGEVQCGTHRGQAGPELAGRVSREGCRASTVCSQVGTEEEIYVGDGDKPEDTCGRNERKGRSPQGPDAKLVRPGSPKSS